MKTKTNLAILIGIIFVATIGIVWYTMRVKNLKRAQQAEQANHTQQTQEQIPDTQNAKVDEKLAISTVFVTGQITKIDKNVVTIKNGDATNDFTLPDNLLIFANSNGTPEKKNLTDLKEQMNVRVEINTKNSEVVSVEIVK